MRRRHLLWLLPLFALLALLFWPVPEELVHPPAKDAVRILDREGTLLYEARLPGYGSQRWIALEQMPPAFLSSVIAIEDRGFLTHPGISAKGITRALIQNLSAGRIVSGGSTITQQLVRSRLQPKKRNFLYKVREAILALKIERALSKEQILESYLNTAYFGHQAYGIAAAAKTYFEKSPQELSSAECAFLAGLLQSPSALDPFEHYTKAKERQQRVLDALEETEGLPDSAIEEARMEPISLASGAVDIRAPHFVMWLLQNRPEAFTHTREVRTTLDLALQQEIERIVALRLKDLAEKNVTSAAVVVLDAHTGDILAMVGSADYFDVEHDGAVNVALASRQPGSALKPFTYALALARGDTAATTIADVETQFFTEEGNPYVPRNYDYGYHGLVRYREALANSYNIAAVKVLERVGVARLLGFLRSAGITTLTESPEHYGLALTLGDGEVKLLELLQAYGIFPRGGKTMTPRPLLSDPAAEGKQILDPKVAWLVTDILSDATARLPEFGETNALTFDFPAAAKTGTTRNSRDNWTLGYTPDVLVGVWVGNADNSPMRDTSGVTGAGPIFHDAMLAATRNNPPKKFVRPAGITDRTICRLSGKLPTPLCPHTMEEKFAAGTEPTEQDDLFRSFSIDRRNGLLANNYCDQTFVEQKGFAVFPMELQKWSRENGWPAPPSQESPLCRSPSGPPEPTPASKASSWLEITRPQPNDSFQLDPLIPDAQEHIIFEARASGDITSVTWYVDGTKVGTGNAPDFRFAWKPRVGTFTAEARSGTAVAEQHFEVAK
ncbi:MAG: penicillin-binding protein 1C [Candidatus Peribacteraceae bacterium]|nr:penicillin-binding protein 1C [Candidatus Peribacteraceae bacterium]